MGKYYQEKSETMPLPELRKLQEEKLRKEILHVEKNNPFYAKKMQEAGVKAEDIQSLEDLKKLPFTMKQDLKDAYPYGMLSVEKSEVKRIHSTSGTTGKRVIAFYTEHDLDVWSDCTARALTAAGAGKNDIVQDAYGYGLFTGGFGVHMGSEKIGAMTLPMSSGNSDRQIQFMLDLGTTVLACTPSYAAYLSEGLLERGYKTEDLPLKKGIFGGEPWTNEMRKTIEKRLGIEAFDIYGLTEMSGPGIAFECEEKNGMHINEDYFIAEIIDPDTQEVLPEGEVGELVLTSIDKEAFPMIRYRTRDICSLSRGKCSCGRTFVKMKRPTGRTDDMMIIRGVNVFPSQIESILVDQGYSTNYQIVLDRVNNSDTFDIYVEFLPEDFDDTIKSIAIKEKHLQDAIKDMVGISPKVHLSAPKTMERSEGKTKHVFDKRILHD